MEVQWSDEGGFIYSPRPREWSYIQWFRQIIDAVRDEYGYRLLLTSQTQWTNIEPQLEVALIREAQSDGA